MNEPKANLGRVADHYTTSFREHGKTPRGVGWRGTDDQALRFDKLCTAIEGDEPFSVNDLGCGYGAMFEHLDRRFGDRMQQFDGYDISQEMLDAAQEGIKDQRTRWFESSKIQHEADYTFTSGIFNVCFNMGRDAWNRHIQDTIQDMARHSRRAFAFNGLTNKVDWKQEGLHYTDPVHWFRYCRDHVSRHVALLHDYPLYEWTLVVRMTA